MTDTPLNQPLYDAVMAEVDGHKPWYPPDMPNINPRHIHTEWYAGWDAAAEVAARIAAERQPQMSDDELAKVAWDAYDGRVTRVPWESVKTNGFKRERYLSIVRAVRTAIGPQVPVIPEGLTLITINRRNEGWDCGTMWDGRDETIFAHGSDPVSALNAACTAAREGEQG